MAYAYQTGTATDIADWFSRLETFLVAVGWTIISGGGTTTVVYNSIGESGTRAKLFIRFRRATQYVWFRVQDDGVGTHATMESATYSGVLTAPGVGDLPFPYWMAADKDKVIVNFKAGLGYSGAYVGVVEPVALTVLEEEQMIVCPMHQLGGLWAGCILRESDGDWNKILKYTEIFHQYAIDLLDDSVPLFGFLLRETAGSFERLVGQPTDITGRIEVVNGLNPEDIITTGFPGATSTWIILGYGSVRWAMRTGGNVPTGQLEGAHFAHTSGIAYTVADFEAKLLAFMQSVGWIKVGNPTPVYPIDYLWYSAGEAAADDIWLHWRYNTTDDRYEIRSIDNINADHSTMYSMLVFLPTDFPTYFYLTADRDCMFICLEIAGIHKHLWGGMYRLFMPDPSLVATPYKVGTQNYMLRAHSDGGWGRQVNEIIDQYTNSSPNLYDGVTYPVWEFPVSEAASTHFIGTCRYLHRISGPGLAVRDTVQVGARVFRYFATNYAYREV